MPASLTIEVGVETWPIAGEFVIARGAKREAIVVVAHVSDGTVVGRGECVPYARYGETVESVRDGNPRSAQCDEQDCPSGPDARRRRAQRARLRPLGL